MQGRIWKWPRSKQHVSTFGNWNSSERLTLARLEAEVVARVERPPVLLEHRCELVYCNTGIVVQLQGVDACDVFPYAPGTAGGRVYLDLVSHRAVYGERGVRLVVDHRRAGEQFLPPVRRYFGLVHYPRHIPWLQKVLHTTSAHSEPIPLPGEAGSIMLARESLLALIFGTAFATIPVMMRCVLPPTFFGFPNDTSL